MADPFNVSLDSLVRNKTFKYTEAQQQLLVLIENLSETECAKVFGFIEGLKK